MQKLVPHHEVEHEIVVVNSRFIASLAPATTVEEAREFIKTIKALYPDASHHVPAYVIGAGNSLIAHCSDDGEPSGTAGRPALAVLQGSGIGDCAVVVTRYFGGTKLGKGGLVRAYGDAVREVLKIAPLAEIVLTDVGEIWVNYPHFEPVKRLLEQLGAMIEGEEFTEQVKITFRIESEGYNSLKQAVIELTAGRAQVEGVAQGMEFYRLVNRSIFDLNDH